MMPRTTDPAVHVGRSYTFRIIEFKNDGKDLVVSRRALLEEEQRAQADIDLRPELYTKHYAKEFPKRFHATMDTRRWGPGERIVFEPYSRQIFEDSRAWISEHGIIENNDLGNGAYEKSVVRLSA